MRKKPLKLQNKFLASIFILILIPLLLIPIISYISSAKILSNKLIDLAEQTAELTVSNINNVVEHMINASNIVNLDTDLQKYLEDSSNDFSNNIDKNNYITSKLENALISNLYLYNATMIFFDFDGNIYSSAGINSYKYTEVIEQDWFKETVANNGFLNWYAPSVNILDYNDGITLTRLIKTYNTNLGVLLIHIDTDKSFNKLLKSDSDFEETERYLVNENMDIITSNKDYDNLLYYDYIINDNVSDMESKLFVYKSDIAKTGWQLIQLIPKNILLQELRIHRNYTITINLIVLLVMMVIAFIISKQITKAIYKLNLSIQEIIDGNLNSKIEVSGSFEVEQLGNNFNFMIDKVNSLINDIRIEEQKKIKYQLEALQSQINPHFLLNTLNGIKWLCVIENAKTSEDMLKSLGNILEKTMYIKNDLISISDELKCIESYVKLQKMRYGKKFEVYYDIDPNSLNYYIPVLLLQPIIENSIIHGFCDIEHGGIININIFLDDDYIKFIIRDNGKGVSHKTNFKSTSSKKDLYDGIGINNVYSRIKLNYKEPCGISTESKIDNGFTTFITLSKKNNSDCNYIG